MKKFIKFLCLLLIAALIAILVLKNAVKANDDILSGNTELTVGDLTTIYITLPYQVTSFSGSINADEGGLSISGGDVTISGSSIMYLGPEAKNSFSFSVTANNAGQYGLSVNITEVQPASESDTARTFSDSKTINVQGTQPPEPQASITIGIDHERIQPGSTAHVYISSIEPESDRDSVTYSSDNESIATVDSDGTITGVSAGYTTIRARTQSDVEAQTDIEVWEMPQPTEFSVSPNSITSLGETTVTVTGGNVGNVSSSNDSVATASKSGDNQVLVNVSSYGTATITISKDDGTTTATVNVNVADPGPGPGPGPEPEGKTPNLTVLGGKTTLSVNGDTTTISSDIPVTWISDNSSVAVVGADSSSTEAKIISMNAGTATITATATEGGKEASVTLTVKKNDDQAAPTITPSSNIKLEVGKSVFVSSNQSVTWSSENPNVASVNAEGLVIGKGVGETRIIAKNKSGKTASVTVKVIAAANNGGDTPDGGNSNIVDPGDVNTDEPMESTSTFAISPRKTQTLNIGETLQIKVTKGTASSWKSSKPAVASVDNNGKVTANSSGIAYITAVASDGSVAQLKIKVRDENGNDPDPGSEANNDVPSTGEASTSLLLVVGALTFIIATFIFRKKTK